MVNKVRMDGYIAEKVTSAHTVGGGNVFEYWAGRYGGGNVFKYTTPPPKKKKKKTIFSHSPNIEHLHEVESEELVANVDALAQVRFAVNENVCHGKN